jgi:hypothetical protein
VLSGAEFFEDWKWAMTAALGNAAAASGPGRVLLLQGYLGLGEPDGGAELLAQVCTIFDDTGSDGGTVDVTLSSLW